MSMKNSIYTIGNRTCDLAGCSAVPQPTAPPAACPSLLKYHLLIKQDSLFLSRSCWNLTLETASSNTFPVSSTQMCQQFYLKTRPLTFRPCKQQSAGSAVAPTFIIHDTAESCDVKRALGLFASYSQAVLSEIMICVYAREESRAVLSHGIWVTVSRGGKGWEKRIKI